MTVIKTFLKGIVAGIGGVAPGLSGSVLMVLMGIYERTVECLGSIFKNFRKKAAFLVPLLLGMLVGVLLFSRVIDLALTHYELATRYAFLGLVLGTIPLFFAQTRKKGIRVYHYLLMALSALGGFFLFGMHGNVFPTVTEPTILQSMLMGVAVGLSSIVPGVDSSVILAALGFYELYVRSLAELNFAVLLPELVGLAVGAVATSALMNALLKRCYSATFAVLFGLFVSMIPSMLNESCAIRSVGDAAVAGICTVVGFCVSYYLGDMRRINGKFRARRGKKKPKK